MKYQIQQLAALGAMTFSVSGNFFSSPLLGQSVEPQANSVPARALAASLQDRFELVADGEFFALPEPSSEDSGTPKREDAVVQFRIHTLFKGEAKEIVGIQLNTDMLILPGTNDSHYAEKRRIVDQRWKDLKPFWEQLRALDQSFESGEIDGEDYDKETRRLEEIGWKRIQRDGLAYRRPRVVYAPIHGTSFYDLGGAIAPKRRFLIGVNAEPERPDIYVLDETFSASSIYWGGKRDYVISEMGPGNAIAAP